jgi:hypothetical protein
MASLNKLRILLRTISLADRNISVDTATRYGLDCPGIESRCGRDFPTRPAQPWTPPNLLYGGYWVSFPGVKRSERGVDHPLHLEPRLKKECCYTFNPPLGLRGRL